MSGKSWANVGICTDRAHGVFVWLDADYGPNLRPQRAQTVLKSPVTTVKEIIRRPPLKSSHEIITVPVPAPSTDLDVADVYLCRTASLLTGSIDSTSSVRPVDRAATCAWLCGGGSWPVRHQTAHMTPYRSTVMAAQRAFASQADPPSGRWTVDKVRPNTTDRTFSAARTGLIRCGGKTLLGDFR